MVRGDDMSRVVVDEETARRLLDRRSVRFHPSMAGSVMMDGDGVSFERYTQHLPDGPMPLGAFSYSQSLVPEVEKVGRYCSIGRRLRVMGAANPTSWVSTSPVFYRARRFRYWTKEQPDTPLPDFDDRVRPVRIGNDVWIGDDVTLKGGLVIGDDAVVAAGSVVTSDVAPFTIVGGNPARVIRDRFAPGLAEALLASAWWRFPAPALARLDMTDPEAFFDRLAATLGPGAELAEDRLTLRQHIERAASDAF
jgi:acetyltransferase-like isoleucine patch superfamily enzyme